jgi:hypothetical protein
MKYQKTEVPGIYKVKEGVLVNADNEALEKYRNKRQVIQSKEQKINSLEATVENLAKDMAEIKNLLRNLTRE